MATSLGLYIEDNLIKYAKVSKNNESVKVESFGVKFYENISSAIKQIIEETYSFKNSISINTNDETYNEINVFRLLNKKDIQHSIKTEFEHICNEKEVNKNLYEERYIISELYKGDDKLKVIHISVPKTQIEQRKNQFVEYKVNNILPVSVCISNLIQKETRGTVIVVNIEKNTTITKITNGSVAKIDIIETGMNEILEKINKKESSFSKAYEICKAATIYTESDRDLQFEENEYLEYIMPTLFKLASQIRTYIGEGIEKVEKVYITGTATVINNLDIYFQDFLKDIPCEILKPNFISNNSKINIKDYIEVNSAIAIALQALEKDNSSINFIRESTANKVIGLLNTNLSEVKGSDLIREIGKNFERFNKQYNSAAIILGIITIAYFVGASVVNKQLEENINLAQSSINTTNARITQIDKYTKKFNNKITEYDRLVKEIQDLNDVSSENRKYKNLIPNLLNNIMTVIPKSVKLVSIENTTGRNIIIKAQSTKYEQIAYFKTKLKTEEILKNVVSDTGIMQGGYLSVTIEGDLP